MAYTNLTQIIITNDTTGKLSLQIDLADGRAINHSFPLGGSTWDVGQLTTLPELNRSQNLHAAVDAGQVSVSVTQRAGDIGGSTQVEPINLSTADAISGDVPFAKVIDFSSSGGGAARDLDVWTANCPFSVEIVDFTANVTANGGSSTFQLRTATGGGGTAVLGAINSGTTGRSAHAGITAGATIAADGTLQIRMSDGNAAGQAIIWMRRN
jgi:hypothetical protein